MAQSRKTRSRKRKRRIAADKITSRELDMHLVDVDTHLMAARSFLLHGRRPCRFPRAVKDLASIFRIRIELRQIGGVRDEARKIGGLGICGRELCCCSFLKDFVPVSIRWPRNRVFP